MEIDAISILRDITKSELRSSKARCSTLYPLANNIENQTRHMVS